MLLSFSADIHARDYQGSELFQSSLDINFLL